MRIRLHRSSVMTVYRQVLKHKRIVYLLVSKRPINYPRGSSRIAYIGATSKGIARVASSVAYRAADVLSGYGLSSMDIRVVTCPPQRNLRTWILLERALLSRFVFYFLEPPKCNAQGKHFRWTPKLDRYFTKNAVDKILTEFDG